jgi:hypothetical protein
MLERVLCKKQILTLEEYFLLGGNAEHSVELHGFISQKTELFITTDVRTLNPTIFSS